MKAVLKKIYNIFPFKKQIYSLLKIFWTSGESVFKHLHFKGIFTVQVEQKRSFKLNHFGFKIENEIFWNGLANSWEKESMKLWITLCKNQKLLLTSAQTPECIH